MDLAFQLFANPGPVSSNDVGEVIMFLPVCRGRRINNAWYLSKILSFLSRLRLPEGSYGKNSIIVTSQLSMAEWYKYINEPTLADAVFDRLTANAYRIELKGESLKKKLKDYQ